MTKRHIAIIGAGLSGLACAERLTGAGASVSLFDKGRGPGGRASTRRSDAGRFDHGAQFFTASDPAFAAHLSGLIAGGHAALWEGCFQRWAGGRFCEDEDKARYVGTPSMNALLKPFAEKLGVTFGTRVARLSFDDPQSLISESGEALGRFDHVVVATPIEQTHALLEEMLVTEGPLTAGMNRIHSAPSWVAMVQTDAPLVAADGLRLEGHDLVWVAHNSAKPGREGANLWIIQASADWSRAHLELDKAEVADKLFASACEVFDTSPTPFFLDAHRWRYAFVENPAGRPFTLNAVDGVSLCGDWHLGSRVEDAWRSGHLLGEALGAQLE